MAQSVLSRDFQKTLLTTNAQLRLRRLDTLITAVGQQQASLGVVGQRGAQDVADQSLLQLRRLNRKHHLDAPAQIAIHPVGRTDVHLWIVVVAEVENTAVFQKAIHNGDDTDVVADARHYRPKRADA